MSLAYREEHLHKQTSVLFEEEKEIDGKRYQIGHTMEYIRAAALSDHKLSGQLLEGSLTGFLCHDLALFQTES
jgi:threonylcarbamoyladenosine tRNA methylthiotransferase MtaB